VIGGNLPDLDLLYSFRGNSHDKLGYLLQHRGYTHTLSGCAILALLMYAGAEGWIRRKRFRPTPRDHLALAGMAFFATLLHLAMDALNSYGVHPFWPVENRWSYGDAVFIVEPLYWVAVAPLFFVVRTLAARVVIALALVGAVLLSGVSHLVPLIWCVSLALLALVLLLVGARTSAKMAALTSAVVMVAITATFIFSGQLAARRVESIAHASFPSDHVIDHVLTPLPANPLCWDVLLLETDGDRYMVRHAMVSNAGTMIPASHCPLMNRNKETTAPMATVQAPDSAEIHWLGEFAMSVAVLRKLVASHCDASALMRFARAPFATELGQKWIIGDLRFDRERGLGMAKIEPTSPAVTPCPETAPWIPPRQDLLSGRSPPNPGLE